MNTSNHSHEKIFPADPRITAYAFGELEGDELKQIEAAVAADPALQAAVAELRGFGGELANALGDEPAFAEKAAEPAPKKRRGWVILFPLHYLATAAAACFAVVVWVRHDPRGESPVEPVPEGKMVAVATSPAPLSELDHRVQVARQAAAAPMPSFGSDARVGETADAALQMPMMADLPPNAASSVSGMGFGKGMGSIGTGTGYNTGLGSSSAQASRPRASASRMPAPPSLADAPLSVTMDVTYKPEYVFRAKAVADAGPMGGFADGGLGMANEAYARVDDNTQKHVTDEPLSTFSISVDTASYANVRRFINRGSLPPHDAVRVEELINYFPYRYAPPAPSPAKDGVPFAAQLDVTSAPWAPTHRLVRVGIKGREISAIHRAPANLVFLIDVSGSMSPQNRLPLVKQSLSMLIDRLRPDDRVAIVTYASGSGLALPSTPVSQKNEIRAALDGLRASGSTNGGMGIHLAYDIAKANFATDGINRVILCTDGDFNVGVTSRADLTKLIEEKAKSRVFLSVFGFGMGNLKDATLSTLSAKGNGTYGYIDTPREASKVFVEQLESTLVTIAKDVKIQVEFNPALVQSYRLIGYESRMLKKEDFNNDKIDAGEIGAGHSVTALYEVVPAGVDDGDATPPAVDPLKYQAPAGGKRKPRPAIAPTGGASQELLTVKIRYKQPEGDVSAKQEFPLIDSGKRFEQADGEFKFAAAVAAWGMILRDSPHRGTVTFEQVLAWAEDGLGEDPEGYRAEFIQLVRRSAELSER